MILKGKVIFNQIDDTKRKIEDIQNDLETVEGKFTRNVLQEQLDALKSTLSKLENQQYTIGDRTQETKDLLP